MQSTVKYIAMQKLHFLSNDSQDLSLNTCMDSFPKIYQAKFSRMEVHQLFWTSVSVLVIKDTFLKSTQHFCCYDW